MGAAVGARFRSTCPSSPRQQNLDPRQGAGLLMMMLPLAPCARLSPLLLRRKLLRKRPSPDLRAHNAHLHQVGNGDGGGALVGSHFVAPDAVLLGEGGAVRGELARGRRWESRNAHILLAPLQLLRGLGRRCWCRGDGGRRSGLRANARAAPAPAAARRQTPTRQSPGARRGGARPEERAVLDHHAAGASRVAAAAARPPEARVCGDCSLSP